VTRAAVVYVEVLLPPGVVEGPAGEVVVRVEDVSRADAPARVVGEARLGTRGVAAAFPLAASVPVDLVDERCAYAVRVHVDVDGDGQVSAGDYVSTQAHPVLTRGAPARVAVPVRQV
jgi:putative lipoprotein